MYTCGLTVYARGHIGNFRTFVCVDVLRRALKYIGGWKMRHVMNFTDVDDKTIAGAEREGVDLREYTDRYIAAFREDAATLGIEPVEETPRATDQANLDAMADMIKQLEARGHTYASDGSIYFKIATMPDYGKLARLDHAGIQAGARVDTDEYNKDDARDFVLWKATRPGEPTWDCGVGPGRPGWHIECSAMALRLLGEAPIDIHTGGVDLVFPHHENEIAQSEGATGKPFSRFWVHTEHLLVDGLKMSKSLGNVYTLSDIANRGFRVSALRYLLLSSHYRKQLNFTWAGMHQAEEALGRVTDFLDRLDTVRRGSACGQHGTGGLRRGPVRRSEHLGRSCRDVRPGAHHQHGHRPEADWRARRLHRPERVHSLRQGAGRVDAASRRGPAPADPRGGDCRGHRSAAGGAPRAQLCRGGPHPRRDGDQGRHLRGRPPGHALETEVVTNETTKARRRTKSAKPEPRDPQDRNIFVPVVIVRVFVVSFPDPARRIMGGWMPLC
jgi:cysteinyl-tRNA synthetase